MAKNKKEHKTIILNGTKVWGLCLVFITSGMGGGFFWAGNQTNLAKETKAAIIEVKADVKEINIKLDEKATRQELSDLRKEVSGRRR